MNERKKLLEASAAETVFVMSIPDLAAVETVLCVCCTSRVFYIHVYFHQAVAKAGTLKLQDWTLQDWTLTDDFAGVDIAGLDIEGLDIDGLDNGGPDIYGLDIAGLDIVGLDIDGLDNDGRMCG